MSNVNETRFTCTYFGRQYAARNWTLKDRVPAASVVQVCMETYGFDFNPTSTCEDAVDVERFYSKGEFLVIVEVATGDVVGTGAFYELESSAIEKSVEIRRLYLLPHCRGKGLGRTLLKVSLYKSVC